MTKRKKHDRLAPEQRKSEILAAAMVVAHKVGFANMTRDQVATQAKCAAGAVSMYFNTMPQLRRAVMREAIQQQDLTIIAEGVALRDKNAMKAPPELRSKALTALHP